jgi:hypothetical protein
MDQRPRAGPIRIEWGTEVKIKIKESQHRRDFTALYECEHCGATKRDYGYDDAYFHTSVIPAMVCEQCGKTGTALSSSPSVPAGVVL